MTRKPVMAIMGVVAAITQNGVWRDINVLGILTIEKVEFSALIRIRRNNFVNGDDRKSVIKVPAR